MAGTPSTATARFAWRGVPGFADWLAVAFVCCVGVLAFLYILGSANGSSQVASGTAFIAAQLILQLAYFSRPKVSYRLWLSCLLLLCYATVVYVPQVYFGEWWLGAPGLLAGSALLVLPGVAAVPLAVGVVTSVGVIDHLVGTATVDLVFALVAACIEGLAVFGLTRLARVVDDLDATRDELARTSVAAERLRFADEVYGELGARLAAIAVRTERVLRVLSDEHRCARSQVGDILTVSRDALADMRYVASRYREPATPDEDSRTSSGATPEPDAAGDEGLSGARMSAWLANFIVSAVLIGFGLVGLASIVLAEPGLMSIVLATAALIVLLVLQLGYFGRFPAGYSSRWVAPAVAVQAVLAYLPVLWFEALWLDLPGFVAGSLLLVLRPLAATLSFTIVLVSVGWLQGVYGGGPLDCASAALSAAITGLVVYGLTRLARSVVSLRAVRRELAATAVAQERLRFARDLHDLLGLGLSAITLKVDLANRLLEADRDQAAAQLREVVELSHAALGGVRSVASGYRELSLDDELASARSVLRSAEVDAVIEDGSCTFHDSVSKVLATVLREGVTNVVRHSKADRCEIVVRRIEDRVQLEIVNDGVDLERPQRPQEGGLSGNGTQNLTHRVSTLGGELIARIEPGGTYRLRATVPAQPELLARP